MRRVDRTVVTSNMRKLKDRPHVPTAASPPPPHALGTVDYLFRLIHENRVALKKIKNEKKVRTGDGGMLACL